MVAISLAGCAVKLAPDYDRTLIEGLTEVNKDAMTFFASLSSGVSAQTFGRRQHKYDSLIGRVDALRIQSKARPVPRPLAFQIFNVGERIETAPEDLQQLDAPTTGVLETLGDTLVSMRNRDKRLGLSPLLVDGFKRRFEISMDQALTYEKALER